jgi:hypothetical protein
VRKRRTREHIIADMSANHVERHALLCGYSVERVFHDYGVDLLLYTYNAQGEVENEMVRIQLKATDKPAMRERGQKIAFVLQKADIDYWLGERLPVMLIVYDGKAEIAYWLHVQSYFQNQKEFDLAQGRKTMTVYLGISDVVDRETMREFARIKSESLLHWSERMNHAD